MEKIIYIDRDKTLEINSLLAKDWHFLHIAPIAQKEADPGYGGDYGAYVVIYKDEALCQNSGTEMEKNW